MQDVPFTSTDISFRRGMPKFILIATFNALVQVVAVQYFPRASEYAFAHSRFAIILSDDAGVPQAMVELVVFVVETFDDMFVWVKVFVLLLYVPDMVVFFVLDARREPRFGADKTSVLLNIQVNTSSDVIKLFLILGIIT